MPLFGNNQEFHPSGPIKSRKHNYTVDYFELRAQPGRGGVYIPGSEVWLRDEDLAIISSLYLGDAVVIGGTSLVSDELLRIVGPARVTELRIGDSVITETAGGITFNDSVYGLVTVSDLASLFWSRDEASSSVYLTNSGDNVLLGQSTGEALKRLQITSEASDGSSYFLYGKNSLGQSVYHVNDLGEVFGSRVFFGSANISIYGNIGNMVFGVGGSVAGQWSTSGLFSSSWAIRNSNPVYARELGVGTGIGFPSSDTVGVYFNNSALYTFSTSSFSFPQNAWLYSGMNLLKVNASNEIELNIFKFIPSEFKFSLNDNTYLYKDVFGNLIFRDSIHGSEISLATLAGQATTYWERDSINMVVYPKSAFDSIRIPSLAGTGNRAVVADSTGKLITHQLINFWKRDLIPGGAIVNLFDPADYLIIGKNTYVSAPAGKLEVWANNDKLIASFAETGSIINDLSITSNFGSVSIKTADGISGEPAGRPLVISSGNAFTGSSGGNLIIKAGDAIPADSSTSHGNLTLSCGIPHNSGNIGTIYFGVSNYPSASILLKAQGSQANVGLLIQGKGAGSNIEIGSGNFGTTIWSERFSFVGEAFTLGQASIINSEIHGAGGSSSQTKGVTVTIKGGEGWSSGNNDGGDVRLYGGVKYGTGIQGRIFIGTGSAGSFPLEGSGMDTSVLMYNRSTGQVTYGDMVSGGGGGVDNAYSQITDGTVSAIAVGADSFKLRSANHRLNIAVTNNDPTHGDNALFTVEVVGWGTKVTGSDSGTVGDISIDDDYIYICVVTGDALTAIWKKSALKQSI